MTPTPRVVLMDAGPWLPVPPPAYGGLENVVATLVTELRARGVRVVLAASEGSTQECEELLVTGEPAFGLLGRPYAEVVGRVHAHAQRVASYVRAHPEVDLVHTHTEVVGPAVLAQLDHAPPVLHTLHWDPTRQAAFYGAFDGRGRVFVNAVSANHERCMPEALRRLSVGAVHLAAPAAPAAPPPAASAPVVVLGRIHPTKGQDAAALACRDAGRPLVLAGPVGPYTTPAALGGAVADGTATHADVAFWRDRVEPLLDGDQRRWVGVVGGADKAALLGGAAALLMPVRWEEPGATVVVEALAAGTPVVALRRGALPELVDHGVTGFLADAEDELAGYLEDVDRIDRAACRRAWAQRFTPAHMADGYLTAYAEVLRRAAPTSSSEASQRRRAVTGSLAAAERPTSAGRPRTSPRPSGPT